MLTSTGIENVKIEMSKSKIENAKIENSKNTRLLSEESAEHPTLPLPVRGRCPSLRFKDPKVTLKENRPQNELGIPVTLFFEFLEKIRCQYRNFNNYTF